MKNSRWLKLFAALFVVGIFLTGYRVQAAWEEYPSDPAQIDASLKVTGLKAFYRLGDSATDYVEVTCKNKLQEGEKLCYDIARDPEFKDESTRLSYGPVHVDGTLYVRAFLKRETADGVVYGPYAYTTYEYMPPRLWLEVKKTTKNSVTLEFDGVGGTSNLAFEVWRAEGSGAYTLLEKTSAWSFTDTGLDPYTRYRYRVRTYAYNPYDGKTVYAPDLNCTTMTWGSDLFFHAAPVSSKKVQLAWTKLAGASGYRIYRTSGVRYFAMEHTPVGLTDGKTTWRLVADLKASKSSYTDKTVKKGRDYTYYIEAYRNDKSGKKTRVYTVTASDSVSLDFGLGKVTLISQKEKAGDKETVSWKKVAGAKGYRIEYNDSNTQKTVRVNLKANQTSYTFTKGDKYCNYSIYAYKMVGKKEVAGEATMVSIDPKRSPAPDEVKAEAVNGNTAVKISWKKVPGADHYQVYRSTAPWYRGEDGVYAPLGREFSIGILDQENNIYNYNIPGDMTSIVDERERTNGTNWVYNEGPQPGIPYYYYVQAYGTGGITAASLYTGQTEIMLPAAGGQPVITKAAAGKKAATVTWKEVAGAKEYAVYYSASKKGDFRCYGRTSGTELKVTGLTPGKKYYFKVRAIGEGQKHEDILLGMSAVKASNAKIKK